MQPFRLAERRRRETRIALIGVAIGLVLILLLVLGLWLVTRNRHQAPAASTPLIKAAPTTPASPPASKNCLWFPAGPDPNIKDVGTPPTTLPVPAPTTMTITTSRGVLEVHVDAATTPCTVASFSFLASKQFFNNTACHRLVTTGLHLLQCGDPSGTGQGGPAYTFPDEHLSGIPANPDGSSIYRRGVVAMANAGANSNGSQFFIVYQDSPLPPNYTEFGTVTSGLQVIDAVGAGGDDGAYAQDAGGGHPKLPITIRSLTVT